jgi:hypothetical protein
VLDSQTAYDVAAGRVRYIDYEKDEFRPLADRSRNILQPFAHKRRSYKHEKEVRAAILQMHYQKEFAEPYGKVHLMDMEAYKQKVGIEVPAEPARLIKSIHVAPGATSWFLNLVKDLVTKRYKLELPVLRSSLDNPAII